MVKCLLKTLVNTLNIKSALGVDNSMKNYLSLSFALFISIIFVLSSCANGINENTVEEKSSDSLKSSIYNSSETESFIIIDTDSTINSSQRDRESVSDEKSSSDTVYEELPEITKGATSNTSSNNEDSLSEYDYESVELNISKGRNTDLLHGIGVEWDAYFWMIFNTRRGVGEEDWELILRRTKEMGIHRIRVMFLPERIEPRNDNDDPDVINWDRFAMNSEYMKSLKRQLDFIQEQGIKVNITYWNAVNTTWLGYNINGWATAPNDIYEYAENVSALLQHLIIDEGYTCIDEITLFNEPNHGFLNEHGVVDFDYYVEMVKAVDERLKRDGLRDKIKICVSDDAQDLNWYRRSVEALHEIGDIFTSHTYKYEISTPVFEINNWAKTSYNIKQRVAPDKPFYITEFGTQTIDAYNTRDIGGYDRALFLPKFAINTLNGGAAGLLHWVLYDQYYYEGTAANAKMKWGLWGFKDEDWKVRPSYFSWSLLTKHTRVGSEIYMTESDDGNVSAVALKTPEGKWTYMVVNTGKTTKKFTVNNPQKINTELKKYIFSENSLPKDDKLIESYETLNSEKGILEGIIGPESFIVLTDIG